MATVAPQDDAREVIDEQSHYQGLDELNISGDEEVASNEKADDDYLDGEDEATEDAEEEDTVWWRRRPRARAKARTRTRTRSRARGPLTIVTKKM
jgi:hypothetical protein